MSYFNLFKVKRPKDHRLRVLSTAVMLTAAAPLAASFAAPLNAVVLNSNIAEAQLQQGLNERLRHFYGQEITAALLEEVLSQVNLYYRELGYGLSEAYLPEQIVRGGVLSVYVHDPKIRQVNINNQSSLNDWAYHMLFDPLLEYTGDAVETSEAESQLLKLSDIGVLDLAGHYSDDDLDPVLGVDVKDRGLFAFNVFSDNHGTKAAGRYRFGGQLKLRNLLGNADTLSLFYARSSEDQNNYALSYEMPISSSPTMLGFMICLSDYELGREYEDLGAKGEYQSYEIYLRHPILRSQTQRLDLNAGIRYRDLTDEFSEFDVSFKKETLAGYVGLSGAWSFDNNALLGAYASMTCGRLNIKEDDFEFYDDGWYGLLNMGATLEVPVTSYLSFDGLLDAQLAARELDSSEYFVASGASGVSAYNSSAAQGDQGFLASAGLAFKPFDFNFKIRPHLDFACVQDLDLDISDSFAGAGLELKAEYKGFYAKLDFSHVIGPEPEGDFDEGQVFFSVGCSFY